ncbi:MAG: response regulator [Alphaproteobacteria bacterium]|nr:response regulator [Alphaproteobacteria bacterium]
MSVHPAIHSAVDAPVALIVDDEVSCSRELANVLTRNKIPSCGVSSVAEAREALAKWKSIRVLISDIRMPGMSGLDFAADLSTTYVSDHTLHLLFMTGEATVDSAVTALRLGASDFLTKPLKPRDIVQRVEKLLAKTGERTPAVAPPQTAIPNEASTQVRWLLQERRYRMARERVMGAGFGDEPGWNMLMELMHARLAAQQVPVSALCAASGVPQTSALRRLSDLMSDGLVVKERDPKDARRIWVSLTDRAIELIEKIATQVSVVH